MFKVLFPWLASKHYLQMLLFTCIYIYETYDGTDQFRVMETHILRTSKVESDIKNYIFPKE